MRDFTLILPYYDQPAMLARQVQEWEGYPEGVRVIVVDDASPGHPAVDIIPETSRAWILRVEVDIPWNRNHARNLGAHVAETDWILHTDIDHILPVASAQQLLEREVDPAHWYRFARDRVGRADETRQKDALSPDAVRGSIKPHVDSFLCTRELYWKAGGYDEDFRGSLGGSSLFLKHMGIDGGDPITLPIKLEVHTSDSVSDASENKLPRDRTRYMRIRQAKRDQGDPKPKDVLRCKWERVR